jgi:hypothetical protein
MCGFMSLAISILHKMVPLGPIASSNRWVFFSPENGNTSAGMPQKGDVTFSHLHAVVNQMLTRMGIAPKLTDIATENSVFGFGMEYVAEEENAGAIWQCAQGYSCRVRH